MGDDEARGRSDGKGGKDGKGNVLVSVRVRPDVGMKDSKQEKEWEIDNKTALIAYRGREGGDYYYGMIAQHP